MNKAERIKAGAAIGAGVAAVIFMISENSHGWDPAGIRRAEVVNCAPDMPLEAKSDSLTIPKTCRPFTDDLENRGGVLITYDLPSRADFIDRFTPPRGYNGNKMEKYARNSIIIGSLIGGASILVMLADVHDKNIPKDPEPTPPTETTLTPIEEYRRRYRETVGKQNPPDDMTKEEIHELALHTLPEYRQLNDEQ